MLEICVPFFPLDGPTIFLYTQYFSIQLTLAMQVKPLTAVSLLLVAICSCTTRDRSKEPGGMASANDGVFTTSQVDEGFRIYQIHCAACHGRDLRGTEGGTALIVCRHWFGVDPPEIGVVFSVQGSDFARRPGQ